MTSRTPNCRRVDRAAGLTGISLMACVVMTGSVTAQTVCQPEATVDRFEERMNTYETLRFTYHRSSRSPIFGVGPTEVGEVWVESSGRYRIETQHEVFVQTSDSLYTYSRENKQVTIRAQPPDTTGLGPTGFFGSLRRDFFPVHCRPDTAAGADCCRLRLAARTETAAIQRLTLWIDTTSWLTVRADYVDYNEESVILDIDGYRLDHPDDARKLIFTVPDSVDTVVLPPKKRSKKRR